MATLSRMMKKAASSVISVANRTQRNYNSAVFITPLKISAINTSSTNNISGEVFRTASIPRYFSDLPKTRANSDDTFLSVIKTVIDRAEEGSDNLEVAGIPTEFPFKIVDNAEEQIVTLTREYQGELIKVAVQRPDEYNDEDESSSEEDEDEYSSDEEEKKFKSGYIQMFVSITKKNRQTLQFHVVADPDKLTITSLALENPNASDEDIAYEGPEFSSLGKNLQEGLYSYLEVRGIRPSITKFFHNYLIRRRRKKHIAWMKNLKNVITN